MHSFQSHSYISEKALNLLIFCHVALLVESGKLSIYLLLFFMEYLVIWSMYSVASFAHEHRLDLHNALKHQPWLATDALFLVLTDTFQMGNKHYQK